MIVIERPKNYAENLKARPEISSRCILCGRPLPTILWTVYGLDRQTQVAFRKASEVGNTYWIGSNCLHEHQELRDGYATWVHPYILEEEHSEIEGKEIECISKEL